MDDSICTFAKDLLERAKAREGLLKGGASALKTSEGTAALQPEPRGGGNKENKAKEEEEPIAFSDEEDDTEDGLEAIDEDESIEDEDDRMETSTLPPVTSSALLSKQYLKVNAASSSSPLSRKSRLNALAQSINAWEDDVAGQPPVKKGNRPTTPVAGRTPRFSVSTPPTTANRLSSSSSSTPSSQRNSCHQFVSTKTSGPSSPTRKIQAAPESGPSSSRRQEDAEETSNKNKNAKGPPSPVKTPTPVLGVASGGATPLVELYSPQKEWEERRKLRSSSTSPQKKTTTIAHPATPTSVPESNTASPKGNGSPKRQLSQSPTKRVQQSEVVELLESSLKNRGMEKTLTPMDTVETGTGATTSKISSAILNKKRMFEKDEACDTSHSAAKISKPSKWAPVTSSGQVHIQTHNSPPKSLQSRKSLQLDPSELSVAQKAKLFEQQRKEQEASRQKEEEVNTRLARGRVGKIFANKPLDKATEGVTPVQLQSKPSKPQFYFGQTDSSVPPPPPPLPSLAQHEGSSTPVRTSSVFPRKKLMDDADLKEIEGVDEDDVSEDEKEDLDVSPSAMIARSIKPIKMVTKDDRMYPCLTDMENTEAETDGDNETNTSSVPTSPPASMNSSMSTSSLGSFIANKAQHTVASEFNTTLACGQIDAFIGEALEGHIIDDDTMMMEAAVPLSTSSPLAKKPMMITDETGSPAPLLHSISLYRKNQKQLKHSTDDMCTPGRNANVLETLDEAFDEDDKKEELHDQIQLLEQQVGIQQKSIAQASKALNICETSFEFSNSTENVEGERVLLLATQKRSQLLSHISKLRHGKNDADSCIVSPSKDAFKPSTSTRGTMRINNMQLYPIKSARLHQDYVYHFIVLVKYNETVLATSTVKASGSSTTIDFPNEFVIPELDPGFRIQVEVYALRTFKQIDVIPHHMKYHIKTPSTPSNKGSTLSKFLTPTSSSKGTPKATDLKSTNARGGMAYSNATRTSNFTLQSVVHLNLGNINKTEWEMSMVNSSLIHPNISMELKCSNTNELTHKGFLTVFSDISGLGHWNRRWAALDTNYRMLFWTYPEDEAQNKSPVLEVSLVSCINLTPRVAPTPRDVCARPNTFRLISTRKPQENDVDSLVMDVHKNYTAIKHMFSADDRQERDAWIGTLNKCLTNIRAWGIGCH